MPDPNLTIIAVSEHDGGLACEPDAGWRSGEDDRAGFERGTLGEECDGLTDVEDLVSVPRCHEQRAYVGIGKRSLLGITVLEHLAIERAREREYLWIRDGVVGNEAGSEGGGVVCGSE